MTRSVPCRRGIVALSAIALTSPALLAGDLTPPPGPVAATAQHVLSQTGTPPPYTISAPGSYRLISNLTGPGAGAFVVRIGADNVTLDLGGFTVDAAGGTDAIVLVSGHSGVTIRNGVVANGAGYGFDALGSDLVRVENLTARDCGTGIRVARAALSNCIAADCQADGIFAQDGCNLSHCVALRNGQGALGAGIQIVTGCVASACSVRENNLDGFIGNAGCLFQDCVSRGNGDHGFSVSAGSTLRGCNASQDAVGFELINSTARQCDSDGCVLDGFIINSDSTVDQCRASNNGTDGFLIADRCTVTNCHALDNAVGGIYAGFTLSGLDSRVAGCTAQNNGTNYIVTGVGNVIVANTSVAPAGGTHYSVGAGNDAAPIVTAATSTNANDNIAN